MKTKTIKRILSIDPGLKDLGYAVLDGGTLIIAGVKPLSSFPHAERPNEARAWVKFLLHTFKPLILIIEQTNGQTRGPFKRLHKLAESFLRLGKASGLKTFSYPAQTVRKALTGSGWATKSEIARVLVGRLPVLRPFLTQDRKWRERYFQNLFDAVALGLYHHLHRTNTLPASQR